MKSKKIMIASALVLSMLFAGSGALAAHQGGNNNGGRMGWNSERGHTTHGGWGGGWGTRFPYRFGGLFPYRFGGLFPYTSPIAPVINPGLGGLFPYSFGGLGGFGGLFPWW